MTMGALLRSTFWRSPKHTDLYGDLPHYFLPAQAVSGSRMLSRGAEAPKCRAPGRRESGAVAAVRIRWTSPRPDPVHSDSGPSDSGPGESGQGLAPLSGYPAVAAGRHAANG